MRPPLLHFPHGPCPRDPITSGVRRTRHPWSEEFLHSFIVFLFIYSFPGNRLPHGHPGGDQKERRDSSRHLYVITDPGKRRQAAKSYARRALQVASREQEGHFFLTPAALAASHCANRSENPPVAQFENRGQTNLSQGAGFAPRGQIRLSPVFKLTHCRKSGAYDKSVVQRGHFCTGSSAMSRPSTTRGHQIGRTYGVHRNHQCRCGLNTHFSSTRCRRSGEVPDMPSRGDKKHPAYIPVLPDLVSNI
jgi:hypothetical protein